MHFTFYSVTGVTNFIQLLFIHPIDPNNLIKTAKTLKPKLSSGYDNISNKLLLHIIEDIAEPFTHYIL